MTQHDPVQSMRDMLDHARNDTIFLDNTNKYLFFVPAVAMCDYLRNQIVGSKSIEVLPYGILDFRRASHELVFLSDMYDNVVFSNHPLTYELNLCFEFSQDKTRVCIIGEYGDELFLFDAKLPGFLTNHKLERVRGDDPGFMKTYICRRGSRFLLIYESGVLCLNGDGEALWSLPDVSYSWGLVEVTEELLTIHDDKARNRLYSLIDGNEVTVPS